MKKTSVQKALVLFLAAVLLCGTASGCADTSVRGGEKDILLPLTGFEDVTDKEGNCTYQMVAELTDTYVFACEKASAIEVVTPSGTFTGETDAEADVKEGDTVSITVSTAKGNQKVSVIATAKNHERRVPYLPQFTVDPATLDLEGDASAVPQATELSYVKREGGTYVYLNNPEKLQAADVGRAIQRDKGLTGDVQVTWEHSNFTGQYIYLGYQLKNEGDSDVYVTVTNIGYQIVGEWLGQQSWSDYYNHKFELPDDYFTDDKKLVAAEHYQGQDFIDYDPRAFQPMTYRIPAGEYIYVLGGTTSDAFNNTGVADTADKLVLPGRCTNAVAKFTVSGGEVTGTFYCYTDTQQVKAEPEEQGYITMRDGTQFGLQYKGVDHHAAIIENNAVFYVNDNTPAGSLPVTFTQSYDEMANWRTQSKYGELKNETHTYEGRSWVTNINAQAGGSAVGTDMSSFECRTTDGETVTIDVDHTDGTGQVANLGNWMIDYHDNLTLVNQGDTPRTFTINKRAQGALMAMVMDPEGNVLSTKCTIVPLEGGPTAMQWEIYEVTVEPHSYVQLCVSFLLMGNSYGNVSHWIDVQ